MTLAAQAIDPPQASEDAGQANAGVIVAVRGSVVDVRFDGRLPPIDSVLRAGQDGAIVIEVLAQQ